MSRARRGAPAALGATLIGCATEPSPPPPTPEPLVGYYACTGTNDPSLAATGFVELRADGSCDVEYALTANERTDPTIREVFVDEPVWPLRLAGRWREGDAGRIEFVADESAKVPELVLYRSQERSLDLAGPCLSICFVWARSAR